MNIDTVTTLPAREDRARKPFSPLKLILFLLLLEIVYSGISIAVTFGLVPVFGTWSEMAMYVIRFPIMFLICRRIGKTDCPDGPRKIRKLELMKLCSLFFLIYVLPTNLIFKFLVGAQTYASYNQATSIINALFIAPVLEEIVYRGIFYRIARRHADFLPAAVATGFAFVIGHASLPQMFVLLFANLALCAVMEETGNLRYTIAMHLTLNWLNWIGALIPLPAVIAFPIFAVAQVVLVRLCLRRDRARAIILMPRK